MQGYAIQRIPEEIFNRSHSATVTEYLSSKYGKYGFKREHPITYNPEFKPSYTADRYRWVENVSDGLRKVGDADDIVRLNHTGYYADNFQDEIVHGEVYQLPTRHGEPQYVPAINDPCNKDCACVDFSSVTTDKEDAARWADHMAEMWAEESREAQAKDDAERRLEEIADEIKQTYADYRKVIRQLRDNPSVLAVDIVRQMIRNEWRKVKSDIHKLRAEAKKIEQNGMEY